MRDKIKNFKVRIKNGISNWFADLMEIRAEMFNRHPCILGHIEGCIIIYWFILIGAFVVSLIKKKRYVWTLVEKK